MSTLPTLPDVPSAQAYLASFDPRTRRRSKEYLRHGLIHSVTCQEDRKQGVIRYTAKVQGSELYTTSLFYEGSDWDSECSCAVSFDCKHACALLTALLEGKPFSSTPAVPAPATATDTTATGAARAPAHPLEARLVQALGRPLELKERKFVDKVHEVYARCRQTLEISGWDLQEIAPAVRVNGWEHLKLWPSFPKTEEEFWQYIALALQERGIVPPKFMQPVSDLSGASQTLAAWRRQQHIARWQQQLAQLRFAPAQSAASVLDFRLVLEPREARLEWKRSGESAFQPIKATQFKRFMEEYRRGELSVVPEAHPLWHTLFQPHQYYYRQTALSYDYGETKQALNHLLRMPLCAERLVTSAGVPFQRPAEPLRWQLDPAPTEADDYELRLVMPDGTAPAGFFLRLEGKPTLYVNAQAVYSGPSSMETLLPAAGPTAIPAPALESRDGLDLLLKLGLDLPPRMEERVQRVAMRVRIFCKLKPTYAGSATEMALVRVVAEAKAGNVREEFSLDGWHAVNTSPASKPQRNGDKLYVCERAPLQAFPAALDLLGAAWDNLEQCWRLRVAKNFPEKFVPWLQSLPKEVEVNLDKDLATLTQGPVAAFVKLECEPAGVDWFDLKVVLDVSATELTPEEIKVLLDARGRYVRLGKKGWRRLQFNVSEEEDQRLARLGLSPHDFSSEPQRLHALQLADEAATKLLPEPQVQAIQRRAGEIKTRVTPPVPDSIRAQLRPYQIDGFHFLAYLGANRFGGILADDMGLGKTLQALTWLAWLREPASARARHSLVVCPKSVMDNWRGEAERFLPGLRVNFWKGTETTGLTEALEATDLLVLNYTQFRALADVVGKVTWHAAILDEGQYIKNPESQTARAARSLKADHRLVLTGTPIENRLLDLWSLMAFAMPGVLGNRTHFARRFDQADDPLARQRLSARVRPFLLRRTKAQVAPELPDRIEEDLLCQMEGVQKTLYRAELKRAQHLLLRLKTRQELDRERFNVLTSLLRLRQICCHPALYAEDANGAESAKLNALLELLEPLMEEGHKVLVFSQFVTMLEILRRAVTEKGWPHFYLAGDTENRGELVAKFQSASGAAVFLVSLKAGGFGLNLTAASYVVLFDPWWNPAVENQAIDRTHRIGQSNKVMAYRLLMKESIEEKIRTLQRSKAALAEGVLGEESFAKGLTLDDLHFLFSDEK